ncbi:MAG: ORF6N domain-containing protein [Bacteriovorax sp.]|nr:ORF6N domain-containing protein [Bacteriovorax sp.]
MTNATEKLIEKMIYVIRDQKVMIDSDLAKLYGVETRIINRNVKRNIQRFPGDFMFQLDEIEHDSLISQIGISNVGRGGRRIPPYVFTENGVAMLSSVLNSENAILVNISIIRIFTKLRSFLMMENSLNERVTNLEKGTNQIFKIVFERLDSYEEMITPKLPENRKKIGLRSKS